MLTPMKSLKPTLLSYMCLRNTIQPVEITFSIRFG